MQIARVTFAVLLAAFVVTGCEQRDPDPNGETGDAAATVIEPIVIALPPGQVGSDSAEAAETSMPAVTMAGPNVRAAATDLQALSAVLDVPVSGVPRSALRDSFTERRGDRVHEALDIHAPRGTPVLSAADGRLLKMFNSRPGGLMVYATDASERFILLYGHLDAYADGLVDGMPLVRGQVIGYVGTTGNAQPDAPHLHFGILRGQPTVSWSEGVAINPYPLLTGERQTP